METISKKIYTFPQLQPAFVLIAQDFWRLSEPVADSKFGRASRSFAYRSDVCQSLYLAVEIDEQIMLAKLLLHKQQIAKRYAHSH